MSVQSVMPRLLPDAATVVLACRHRVDVPSRRRLDLLADGWYAALWCPWCQERRQVTLLIFRPRRGPSCSG